MAEIYSPNGKRKMLSRWRIDAIQRAIGAVTCHGGHMRGNQLGAILGISPRGLRVVLVDSGYFLIEYRAEAGDKDQAWYRINPACLPPEPQDMPPLRRVALPGGGKTKRILITGHQSPGNAVTVSSM